MVSSRDPYGQSPRTCTVGGTRKGWLLRSGNGASGNRGTGAVGVRGETFSGEDSGGMGIRGGRVIGRGRKGLTYLGAEVGGSGSAGAVVSM